MADESLTDMLDELANHLVPRSCLIEETNDAAKNMGGQMYHRGHWTPRTINQAPALGGPASCSAESKGPTSMLRSMLTRWWCMRLAALLLHTRRALGGTKESLRGHYRYRPVSSSQIAPSACRSGCGRTLRTLYGRPPRHGGQPRRLLLGKPAPGAQRRRLHANILKRCARWCKGGGTTWSCSQLSASAARERLLLAVIHFQNRTKDAVAAADIEHELEELKSAPLY